MPFKPLVVNFCRARRIRKTDDFSSVFRLRRQRSNRWFQVYMRPNGLLHARLGLVVGKKVAKRAVHRNYMKRCIRETFRLCAAELGGVDYVVRVRQHFDRRETLEVRRALESLLRKFASCPVV